MSHVARNSVAILAAVVAAYIALAIASTIDTMIGYPRSFSGVAGEMILRFIGMWPFLVAAIVLGVVAASIGKPSRRGPWLLIVCILAAGLYATFLRYVTPELLEWLKTVLAASLVGAAAAGAFWLIARRTATAPVP